MTRLESKPLHHLKIEPREKEKGNCLVQDLEDFNSVGKGGMIVTANGMTSGDVLMPPILGEEEI
jgi:hypothetical protein